MGLPRKVQAMSPRNEGRTNWTRTTASKNRRPGVLVRCRIRARHTAIDIDTMVEPKAKTNVLEIRSKFSAKSRPGPMCSKVNSPGSPGEVLQNIPKISRHIGASTKRAMIDAETVRTGDALSDKVKTPWFLELRRSVMSA